LKEEKGGERGRSIRRGNSGKTDVRENVFAGQGTNRRGGRKAIQRAGLRFRGSTTRT